MKKKLGALWSWMRRHPIWSLLLVALLGFVIFKAVTPTEPTYA